MTSPAPNSFRTGPDENGLFGIFGGRFVAETLMPNILELQAAYETAKADPAYRAELDDFLEHYVGRPSPLYFAERLTEHLGSQHFVHFEAVTAVDLGTLHDTSYVLRVAP